LEPVGLGGERIKVKDKFLWVGRSTKERVR